MDTPERGPEEDMSALERRIGRWRPAAGVVDRDRVMFEAGRAAAHVGSWGRLGFASAACLALVASGLVGLLVRERGHRRALEAVLAARAPALALPGDVPPPVVAPGPDSYLVLTHRWHAGGLDDATLTASSLSPGHDKEPPEPPLSPLSARGLGRSSEL
jgi:hypothetical protein